MAGIEPTQGGDTAAWLKSARAWAESLIRDHLSALDLGPSALRGPVEYAMLGPGKRVRPALCKMVFGAISAKGDGDASVPLMLAGAFAVECIHTYSLVHDDLPCMDDDDLRRGRATVHRAFDEATAVLVGDSLQALAFEALAAAADAAVAGGDRAGRAVLCLARASGGAGMVGGQVLDLASEGKVLGAPEVEAIHRRKTAALLGAAAELGAIAASGSIESAELARSFGHSLGMCFQAMDDVLDVTGDAGTLGKTPGKDQDVEKGTLVAALGLSGAQAAAARHASDAKEAAARLGLGDLGAGFVDLLLTRKS